MMMRTTATTIGCLSLILIACGDDDVADTFSQAGDPTTMTTTGSTVAPATGDGDDAPVASEAPAAESAAAPTITPPQSPTPPTITAPQVPTPPTIEAPRVPSPPTLTAPDLSDPPEISAPKLPDPPEITAPEITAPEITVRQDEESTMYTVDADILFDLERHELRPDALAALREISASIEHRFGDDVPVTVEGHTDWLGTEEYNQGLSERRAASVAQWLTDEAGWDPDRITTVGHGLRRPVAPNAHPDGSDNPDGRQANRRVEIIVEAGSDDDRS